MASLSNATGDRILNVIAEFDDRGEVEMLRATGYRNSRVYRILLNGRTYPSKAVVGHAAGLRPDQFFGGVAQVVPHLQSRGFKIVACTERGTYPLAKLRLVDMAGEYRPGQRRPEAVLSQRPAAVFNSGSNRPGEIRGMSECAQDVGVVATELNLDAIRELEELAGSDVQVFVDSGAFSETEGKVLDWGRIMDVYLTLALKLRDQLWIVAPDKVGDQSETLGRLHLHRDTLRELSRLGVKILVPIQKGDWSQAEFYDRVKGFLIGINWTPAMPCKRAATTPEEFQSFMAQRGAWVQHVHFLGLGNRNRNVEKYLDSLKGGARTYSLDANWIRANVGRGRKTRPYTAARDVATTLIACSATVAELALLMSL
jgi:hypothetical protein